jgi:hypothetical protein
MHRIVFVALTALTVACSTGSESESEAVPFEENDTRESERGAFSISAWTEDGQMDVLGASAAQGETLFFHVTMPTLEGDGRGIPDATVELFAGADLGTAEPLDVTVAYEGDGVYRASDIRLEAHDAILRVEVSTVRVADGISYRLPAVAS